MKRNGGLYLCQKKTYFLASMNQIGTLGISFGTALIVLLALYFIIKWAFKNGIKEAYRDITGKVTTEDIEAEQICNEEEK